MHCEGCPARTWPSMGRSGMPILELRFLTSHSTSDILNCYTSLDPTGAMQKYFAEIQPLLQAIVHRSCALGITPGVPRKDEQPWQVRCQEGTE